MGMDLSIYRQDHKDADYVELYYVRKFWELLDAPFVKEYSDTRSNGYIDARITKESDFDELLQIAIHTQDYWNDYESVPALCRARDRFIEDKEDGTNAIYTLHADW